MTIGKLIRVAVLASVAVGAGPASQPAEAPAMETRCRALYEKWQARLGEERMHTVIAPPFVISGDGSARAVAGYRDRTINAAMKALEAMYFEKPPTTPILILLFETDKPYERISKDWFDEEDIPHYGYFRSDNVMVMNVGTGTGTLVHELTHALMKPDFPTVPSWFNEGLASLYEQCNINNETITGLVNWRLPALQKAIKEDRLRSFSELLADRNFYDDKHVGLNYGQARYLMMYLQEKGKLRGFYKDFRDHTADDPTGKAALERAVAPAGLKDFEATWRKWVMGL